MPSLPRHLAAGANHGEDDLGNTPAKYQIGPDDMSVEGDRNPPMPRRLRVQFPGAIHRLTVRRKALYAPKRSLSCRSAYLLFYGLTPAGPEVAFHALVRLSRLPPRHAERFGLRG